MSIELNVYGRQPDLAKISDIEDALGRLGWAFIVCRSTDDLVPLTEPELGSAYILAWKQSSPKAEAIRQALVAKDDKALQKHFESEEFAVVDVMADEQFSADPEILEEMEEVGIEPEYLSVLKGSPLCYTLRTSAARNDLSFELQQILWATIGVAVYGLLHDPETDEFKDFSREKVERDDS